MNIKTLKVIAIVLLVVIVLGAGIYWMVSGMSNKGLEGFQGATATTVANTISLLDTQKGTVNYGPTGSKYEITYKYVTYMNNFMNNLVYSYISDYTYNGKIIANSKITSKLLENLNGLVLNTHYKLIPKTELVFMKIYDFFVASYPAKDEFVLPGDIICKSIDDIPDKVMIFNNTTLLIPQISNSSVLTNVGLGREKIKLEKNNTPNLDVNLYISNQGLLRSMADNDDELDGIIITVWTYPQAFFVGQTNTSVSSNNKIKYEIKNRTIKLSSSDNKSVPDFQPFAVNNKALYEFNLATISHYNDLVKKIQTNYNEASKKLLNTNIDLTKTKDELTQKKAELTAASVALNNAIKSASVEGFQTVGTTTTTTTAQVVSPIMAKINQLKELQAQKAVEFANAKATAEAQAKKASNNAVKAIDNAKSAANAQVKAAEETAAILQSEKAGLMTNKSRLETEKAGLMTNKSRLETEKAGLMTNKSRLETEKAGLMTNKSKLEGEIASAETKLNLSIQKLSTSVSTFQDVSSTTPEKTLDDNLEKLDAKISDIEKLKTEKQSIETKLTDLRNILQGAQFTTDPMSLGYELAKARSAINNPASNVTCPPPPACPPQQACPPPPSCPPQQACQDISALDIQNKNLDTRNRDLMNANASLAQEIDTKAAKITELNDDLGIKITTINQLNDRIANFDKALTNEERQALTDAKNAAEIAKLEIEKTLKLTEDERDMAIKNRNELSAKYDACESSRRNLSSASTSPVFGGPMMGGRPPSYVCNPMSPNGGRALDKYAMPILQNNHIDPTLGSSLAEIPSKYDYPPTSSLAEIPSKYDYPPTSSLAEIPSKYDYPPTTSAELLPIPPQQQELTATDGIADTSLSAATGFTDIPKHKLQQLIQNARSNPYWTYRPENYDSHDRYAAPTSWWVTGYNA